MARDLWIERVTYFIGERDGEGHGRARNNGVEIELKTEMPRYDDRYWNTRLYVGRLSSRTRARDLEDLFSKYGRVRDVDMKHDFAFVEFRDPRDADDARYALDGRDFGGSRLIVEFARGGPRGPGGSREYLGRGPPPGTGRCFNCGIDGHWARDCKAGDWKNKCYRCGERGHIERNCQNSPKSLRRGRSYSRSVSRSPSPRRGRGRGRGRSPSRSRSYSRSRSPPARRERDEKRSRSPAYSRSPIRDASPPSRGHSLSPSRSRSPRDSRSSSPEQRNGAGGYSPSPRRARGSPSPRDESMSPPPKERKAASSERDGSDYEQSPRRGRNSRSRSPMSEENGSPYDGRRYHSPEETNGRSASPRDDDDDTGGRSSPRDESPRD